MIQIREKGRRRDIEREGERGERDIERERVKGRGIEREWKEEDREEEKISTSIPSKISQTAIW